MHKQFKANLKNFTPTLKFIIRTANPKKTALTTERLFLRQKDKEPENKKGHAYGD